MGGADQVQLHLSGPSEARHLTPSERADSDLKSMHALSVEGAE